MKLTVGVYGSASGEIPRDVREKVRELGRLIAKRGYYLLTGACPGIPYEAVIGCKQAGGMTVGVSPALNLFEHTTRYDSPAAKFDVIVYTGDGLMGREVTAVRSCDVVIFAGGRSGTLGEFAIAYDEGKPIGVLEGSGGIAHVIPYLLKHIHKKTRSRVVFDRDPERLVERLLAAYRGR